MSYPPTQTQQSQFGKTHENFCIRFCEQVEKNNSPDSVRSPQYDGTVTKILTQMSDEFRWNKFCNFLRKKSELDGGELLRRFCRTWFIAVEGVDNWRVHTMRMFNLVFELMIGDTLKGVALSALESSIISQLRRLDENDLGPLCSAISDMFIRGVDVSKMWIRVSAEVLRRVSNIKRPCFIMKNKPMKGTAYTEHFLFKLLDDVLVTDSFIAVISLVQDCSLDDLLADYTYSLLSKTFNPEVANKLVCLLPSMEIELVVKALTQLMSSTQSSEDFLSLCSRLHAIFQSRTAIAKAAFSILKKDRHLVTSRLFALVCMMCLCNTPRMHTAALTELRQCIVKLWRHGDKLKGSAWLSTAVGECDMETLSNHLDTLLGWVSKDCSWNDLVGESLKDIAFLLVSFKGKVSMKITNGRVDGEAGVFSMGKRLLVTLAGTQPEALHNLLERIFKALANSHNNASAIVLIDVVVTIVLEHTARVLNSWKSLRRLTDIVCYLKQDIGVALVRALLPVIVQREQLVTLIVAQMRRHMLSEKTAPTALSILLLLLRSSTIRAAVRNDQYSQAFATFSTQALQTMGINTTVGNTNVAIEVISILKRALTQPAPTRSLLYRGVIESSYANENVVDAALDLLCAHLTSLPPISCEAYIESTKISTVFVEPLPELVQAVSVLMRLCIHGLRNTSTQLVASRDAQVTIAKTQIDQLVQFARDHDVHDLQVDKLSDFSTSTVGRANVAFSSMLIGLYDALVEHLWHVGNVLREKESAEKIAGLLRKRDELNEVLKEKAVKRKESKQGKKIDVAMCSLCPQLQTVSSIINRFSEKQQDQNETVSEECVSLLRENVFAWAVQWAAKIGGNFKSHAPNASLVSLSAFAKANLLLYIGRGGSDGDNESNAIDMWSHLCTDAIVAFSAALNLIVSKYGPRSDNSIVQLWRCIEDKGSSSREVTLNGASMRLLRYVLTDRLPLLLDAVKDFEERKMGADHAKQGLALLTCARALISLVPNNIDKFQSASFKFLVTIIQKHRIPEKPVLREVWNVLSEVARRGNCDMRYTNFLRTVTAQVVSTLGDNEEEEETFESINDSSVVTCAESLVNACSASLSDVRLAIEIISEPAAHADVNAGVVASIELSKRLAEVIDLLLPVHVVYAILKEPICVLLTSLYNTLNSIVKLLLFTKKSTDISEWKSVSEMASLARGHVLRIMETADENVGTLNPLDEPNMKHERKLAKSLKNETLYVNYVRARELYQANLLLLSVVLHDDRLDVQVKHNTIGVRDFRIDTDKLRQRLEEIRAEHRDANGDEENEAPPPVKRRRGHAATKS